MSMGDGGRPVINSSLLATHMPHRADMHAATRHSAEVVCFAQEHQLRYLFPSEIELLAARCGMWVAKSEEFMTGRPPSPLTWSVAFLLELEHRKS